MIMAMTPDERDTLLDILRIELGRLKAEINRTEDRAFKEGLKRREAILIGLIDRIAASAGPAA